MIRQAEIIDLHEINVIYNQAIDAKFQTADMTHVSMESRKKWFLDHNPKKYPIYVYVKESKVIGWCSLSSYRNGRKALCQVAEISYYIHKDHQKQGIGSNLFRYVLKKASKFDFNTLVAILLESNEASIKLLIKNGFDQWGLIPKVAKFDNIVLDHLYYGLKI